MMIIVDLFYDATYHVMSHRSESYVPYHTAANAVQPVSFGNQLKCIKFGSPRDASPPAADTETPPIIRPS